MRIGDEIELLRRRYVPGAKQLSKIPKSRENSLHERSRFSVWEVERHAEKGSESFQPLLEIESRLGTEHRNGQIEQLKRSKEKDRQRFRVNNPSRYCE